MKLIKALFISLLGVILTACGGGEGSGLPSQGGDGDITEPTIISLQITPAKSVIPVGFEQLFIATAVLSDGTTKDVTNDPSLTWTSSDTAIATIISGQAENNGQAAGVVPGTVTITASGMANGTAFSATAQLEVTNATVTTLQVTPTTASIPVGFEQQFTAIVTLSDGRTLDVTRQSALSWSSSDTATAAIENATGKKGIATGMTTGMTTITAAGTANGTAFSATAQLEVTNVIVTALQVTPAIASVPTGFEQQFTAIATLSNGQTWDVTRQSALNWSSSEIATAEIENTRGKKGIAKGVTPGIVTITAAGTANDTAFSATAQLEVTDAIVTALQVNPETAFVPAGLEQQYTATATFSDGSSRDVTNNGALTWTTDDSDIATIISNQVNGNGLAKGIVPGAVTITASGVSNGVSFSATAQLDVTNALLTAISVRLNNFVQIGNSNFAVATGYFSDGTNRYITDDPMVSWTSSDITKATVSSGQPAAPSGESSNNGIVTGQEYTPVGNDVTITASAIVDGLLVSDSSGVHIDHNCSAPYISSYDENYTCPATEYSVTVDANITHDGYYHSNSGIDWAQVTWSQANEYCQKIGQRLPTQAELTHLYAFAPDNGLSLLNWPTQNNDGVSISYWSADVSSSTPPSHFATQLDTGTQLSVDDTISELKLVACLR